MYNIPEIDSLVRLIGLFIVPSYTCMRIPCAVLDDTDEIFSYFFAVSAHSSPLIISGNITKSLVT